MYLLITKIEKSKKGNVIICVDNSRLFNVPLEFFIKNNLKIGDYIDEITLKKLKEEINFIKAKEKALRLLSLRAHSGKELKEKIKNSLGYPRRWCRRRRKF